MKQVHILNGDCLKVQLQDIVKEKVIVMRECLIDGNVQGETLPELYASRANFTAQYPGCTVEGYYEVAAAEIDKIASIEIGSQIICWFEDDLFCQVNFWFVINLLVKRGHTKNISLVRPSKGNDYSFATMTESELELAYQRMTKLLPQPLALLAKLWPLYQQNDANAMTAIAKQLGYEWLFLLPAINAHLRRAPDESGLGYPERQILVIATELGSIEFADIFQCFSAREGIYSFGDLQVKQMFDRVMNN